MGGLGLQIPGGVRQGSLSDEPEGGHTARVGARQASARSDGRFAAPPALYDVLDLPEDVLDVALADVDGNGFDDLAVSDGRVTIWLNDGPGGLVPAEPAWVSTGLGVPDPLRVVDADGSPDVPAFPAAAGIGPLHHQVYWGDAGAAFLRSASNGLLLEYGQAAP
jgi:hypothetical protein